MLKLPRDKVAIDPIFDPDKSPSGLLHIPEQAKERCDQGIVRYIGPDVKEVKIGDYVLFSGYSGTLMNLEGEGLLIIMNEPFIVATIDEQRDPDIPGLYFKGTDGTYFNATYEQALQLIARAFSDLGAFAVHSGKPSIADYDHMR